MNPPKFNRPFGQGNLDLGSCSGESNCDIPVLLDNQITANDGDGGQVGIVFTHSKFTPSAGLFSTSTGSHSELVLTYVGTQSSFSSEDTSVFLMLQVGGIQWHSDYFKSRDFVKIEINKYAAKSLELTNISNFQATEQRPDALVSTIPLMVTVSGVPTTTGIPETTTKVPETTTGVPETTTATSEEPGGTCNKDLEKKYFLSMVVLGACLGGLLTALVLILLCLCCKRSVSFEKFHSSSCF